MAWVTWLTIHIFFLIGFRNRMAVLFDWIWNYFTFTHGARLITGSEELPGWEQQPGVDKAEHDAPLDATSPGAREANAGKIA